MPRGKKAKKVKSYYKKKSPLTTTSHEPYLSDKVQVGDVVEGFAFMPSHGQSRVLHGQWLVFETSWGGGGRAHNDIYPDYHRVKLVRLNRNGTIPRNPKEDQIVVCAQQATFMVDNVPEMKVIGQFDRIVNVKWKRVW